LTLVASFLAPNLQAAPPPNIILITLDTTRADRMGFLGSKSGLTPNLDLLAAQSTIFTRAYSHVPLTTASHATIFTGTYPQFNGVNDFGKPLRADLPYLPDLLHQHGYQTAAFVGSLVLDPIGGTAPGFDRGFDTYNAGFRIRRSGEDRYHTLERRGADVVAHALEWLKGRPRQPFFLWVHVMAPHPPYRPSPPYFGRFVKAEEPARDAVNFSRAFQLYDAGKQPSIDRWRLRYDEWIAQDDGAFGAFLSRLESTGTLGSTAIIVSADHGESFEGGIWGHGSREQLRQIVRVPLIIRLPGQTEGRRIDVAADHTAIASTIMELAGVSRPQWMDGESLLSVSQGYPEPARQRVAFTQYLETSSVFEPVHRGTVGVINGTHQYVIDLESGKGALYELADANVQDNDLASKEPGIAAAMRELILARFPELRRAAA